ncbi:6833_t:CDS:2 [Funneliformis caledonium]|uniref:6833_t:CDS:1 n=1 Tax=Funneliformis caledonium TaxID=1117310 RepID=A0A9N8ZM73_9GLOM|nr:6833_t:CDS:2 [Funneliformis caledonium]
MSPLHKLEITWDKELQPLTNDNFNNNNSHQPHKSIYPISFLHSYSTKQNILKLHYNHLKPILWDSKSILNSQNLWISYNDYMNSDKILLDSLRQLWDYGLVFIKNVPTNDDDKGILNVAERIGTVRSTIYGKFFDVKSIPAANNIAYTSLNLNLHMDLLYYESPPGLQFLHCLKNSVTGGQSIFSDSFKAVQKLKFYHPNYFNLLKKFPLTFHYTNNGHHMHYNRPAIAIDDDNDTLNVNYAPPFQGPIEFFLGSNDDENEINVIEFYRAYQQFCKFIEDPSLKFELTLIPGDLVIFVNRRVLHARKSFDPQSGQRHLKGTYIEYCEFKDKFRVLMNRHDNNILH